MSETPNEGAGVSVEEQDERIKIEAAYDAEVARCAGEYPEREAGLRILGAGYRAALVGAEARERELEEALRRMMPDESSVLVSVADLEAVGRRAEKAEAREAVLVEALKGAREVIEYMADDLALLSPGYGEKEAEQHGRSWLAKHAALAGVVEAEPDGWDEFRELGA